MPDFYFFHGANSLIGGATGALDTIDGAALIDLNGALVITADKFYPMSLDVDNAGDENSPLIIAPDANGGDKRWVLAEMVCAGAEIIKDAVNATLTISCYHNTEATTPLIILRKADGTLAAPALVDDNAVLGTIHFDGHDGSGWHTGAKIEARINGTPSDGTDMPTELTFWVCPPSSATPFQTMSIVHSVGSSMVDIVSSGANGTHSSLFFGKSADNDIGRIRYNHGDQSDDDSMTFYCAANEFMRLNKVGNLGVQCQTPQGNISVGHFNEGAVASLNFQTTHETHTLAAAGTSDTTTISIPSDAMLLGVSFCVNTTVSDDGGNDTWTAAFITGSAANLTPTGAAAAAQNTKVDTLIVPEISTDVCQIQFSANGGSFDGGVIEIVAYYIDLTSLANV